jgi:hypothetical protein
LLWQRGVEHGERVDLGLRHREIQAVVNLVVVVFSRSEIGVKGVGC